MSHVLVQLRVRNRRCVVVGAGAVATRRARSLLEQGAQVVVVAPAASEEIEQMAAEGRIELHRRPVRDSDVEGAFLVVAATDDSEVQQRLAGMPGVNLVTRADDAATSDVLWAAERSFGPVHFAVGTDGRAPAVSAWAADEILGALAATLGADAATLERLVELVAEVRAELREAEPGEGDHRLNWRSALDRSMLDLISSGRTAEAKERLKACRSSS